MKKAHWLGIAAVGLFLGAATASAQETEKSVEGRLLDILKSRGVISETEYGELRGLEADMRRRDDVEQAVDSRVNELVSRMAQDAPKTSYKPGMGMSWATADGKFLLTLGGRIQVRYTHDFFEDENGNQNDRDRQDFNAQRVRIYMKGFAYDPHLKYEIQFDVAGDTSRPFDSAGTGVSSGNTSSNRLTELKDAYVDWQVTEDTLLNVKAGHYKVPYSRQQLTSAFKQEFVDRAPTDAVFAPGRSYGLSFWGKLGGEKKDMFEYNLGLFDGPGVVGIVEGENVNNNDDGLLYVGRMAINPFGAVPYAEGDLRPAEARHAFLLALGVNAWYHQDNNRSATLNNFDDWSIGADLTMMWEGFFATAELHYRDDSQPTSRDDASVLGWTAQLGYMIVPERFEVGLRYSEVDWDDTTTVAPATIPTDAARREYLIVLGYFWFEHSMKMQMDFGRAENHILAGSASNVDEWRLRLQFTLQF